MEDCVDESESLTSPSNMSQKREEEEEEEEKGEEEEEEKEKGDEEREKRDGIEEKEEAGVDATEEREKGEKGESEGGILNNLISNLPDLPVSLPDDAAPATDEASLLISIIHD
ncbi:uncharacterized protein LOC131253422 [Magnolia sinica]|uniref:uncharacterized protein LOC131253422 n=1 Tax=Magnolia sinica TaxID=86752 RepID=UPI0026597EBF|nr:uncharacterized protein LOC131253422 [Magnolia sinica]